MSNRLFRNLIVWGIILLVALPFALQLWRRQPRGEEISYTEFLDYIEAGQVERVRIGEGAVDGWLKNGERFFTYILPDDPSLIALLRAKGVVIEIEARTRTSLWPSLLTTLLPILLLVGLWMLMLRQAQSGSRGGIPLIRTSLGDYLDLTADLDPKHDYVLRIKDNSLADEGVVEGDLLILRRRVAVHDGDLIVARIGDKLTVGRLQVVGSHLRLRTGDRGTAPVDIERSALEGKVVGLFRRLSTLE